MREREGEWEGGRGREHLGSAAGLPPSPVGPKGDDPGIQPMLVFGIQPILVLQTVVTSKDMLDKYGRDKKEEICRKVAEGIPGRKDRGGTAHVPDVWLPLLLCILRKRACEEGEDARGAYCVCCIERKGGETADLPGARQEGLRVGTGGEGQPRLDRMAAGARPRQCRLEGCRIEGCVVSGKMG